MAQRAPRDPILIAFDRADGAAIVPLTDEERRLLAEVDDTEPTITHAEVARNVAALPDAE